jgi:hypothetical protein
MVSAVLQWLLFCCLRALTLPHALPLSCLPLSSLPAPATHEEMREARLPISFRDGCAGLLIPLNKCRQANIYMPFRCGHERHEYEKW